MNVNPFTATSKTLEIDVTATASTSKALPGQGDTIRIVNEGPNTVYCAIGTGTQTATIPSTSTPNATSTAVLSGTDVIFNIASDQIYNISMICRAAGTATVEVQVGEGQ